VEAALTLGHDPRLEARLAVARLLDSHAPVLGVDRLLGEAVAGVANPARRRLAALLAEMLGQLGVHRPLHQPLRQTAQQAIGSGDLLRRARAGEQLIDQLVRQIVGIGIRGDDLDVSSGPARSTWSPLRAGGSRLNSDHAYRENRTDPGGRACFRSTAPASTGSRNGHRGRCGVRSSIRSTG
jgi:hypothetical protein